nr:MAG TPA: hypothetical protein [Caudoviricetes sp.]
MSKHCPNIERMSALARHHFREVTKMVFAVWWYQNFAYLCSVDECTLLQRVHPSGC